MDYEALVRERARPIGAAAAADDRPIGPLTRLEYLHYVHMAIRSLQEARHVAGELEEKLAAIEAAIAARAPMPSRCLEDRRAAVLAHVERVRRDIDRLSSEVCAIDLESLRPARAGPGRKDS